ncbi:response regulator transcription factor [Pedobacter fastidiosus]|uniref:Response regulator n=1 Tax=Pedobacter fastidiosus TaxID=2765361 RepID=A0ABR7KYI0_9SPHI|nr:response regulator [Pedobacter fastidiosus]MBC6113053.1 response regulator [Pedobacter fastidiosus]
MKKRLLIIDDDSDLQDVFSFVFEESSFEILPAYDADNLESKIFDFKPDIILLDISLGLDDGLVICKYLKNFEPTKHIPIILLSAGIVDDETIDCGQDRIVSKPFDVDYLVGVVEDLCQKKII